MGLIQIFSPEGPRIRSLHLVADPQGPERPLSEAPGQEREVGLVLWFHDSTFECIAHSFRVEVFRESMADLLARA
jgi:hypothetical protein